MPCRSDLSRRTFIGLVGGVGGGLAGAGMLLMTRLTSALAMFWAVAGTAFADANYPLPWVAGVTKDSVYVCLEATTTANATVQFGPSTAYGMTATTENYQATDVAAAREFLVVQ